MKLDDLFITENLSVIASMGLLDQIAKKVLFIVQDKKLLATLTDGDIRRWILRGGDLNAPVKLVANYSPQYLKNATKQDAISYIKEHQIDAIPLVDDSMNIMNVVFWNEEHIIDKQEPLELPVVIMAGGKGTRLYPYTKVLPKPLIPIGNDPILEVIMDKFYEFGCKEFHLIVNHKKNMIKAYFGECDKPYSINFEDEDKPLGTGGGLSLLKNKIDRTFILSNCDILITEDYRKIYKLHKETKNLITMICSVKNFTIPYGIVEIGANGEIDNMREKPNLSFFTNTGCYLVEPQVIEELEADLDIGFPDIIEKYRAEGERIGIYPVSEQSWMDMGQLDELQKMQDQLLK